MARVLPRGSTLPAEAWLRRHRGLLAILWAHAAALPVFSQVQGYGLGHSALHASIIVALALAGTVATRWSRQAAASAVAVGLLSSSSLLVHLSGGYIEAHFHFFVVVVLLTLYEDWLPFLMAAGYVAVHHGLVGVLDPQAVYNHPSAIEHPVRWAFVHAGLVAAAGAGAVRAWRFNEDLRDDHRAALERVRAAERAEASAARELRAKAAELERSNRDLEQFAYVVSHDLREPLRTVTAFVDLLRRRYEGRLDGTADEFVHHIVQGTERMDDLIEGVLSVSRAGRAGPAHQPVDMGVVAADVVALLARRLEEARARVEVGELPSVHGDVSQLRQLLQNLVANAVKFSDDDPLVRISAERVDDGWCFSVADNGIGIPAGDRERIFQLFQRLHARDAYDGGTGIGLSVCRRIVERHGGRMWVEDGADAGSVFRFVLPAADAA